MGEGCCGGGCCSSEADEKCSDESCEDTSSMDMSKMMMALANEAWADLMKEKMKAIYEKSMGEKMNKAAHVSVEACTDYWNSKMKGKDSWDKYSEKLKNAMQ